MIRRIAAALAAVVFLGAAAGQDHAAPVVKAPGQAGGFSGPGPQRALVAALDEGTGSGDR